MFKSSLLMFLFLLFALNSSGQTLSTGEVYDVAIGDKLAYTEYIYRGSSGPPLYVFKKVIDKQIFGRDSLHLTYYVGTYGYEFPGWVNRSYEEHLNLYHLDSPYFKNFGEIDTFFQYFSDFDTLKERPYGYYINRDSSNQDTCGTVFNVRYHYSMAVLSGHTMRSSKAYKSLGVLESNTSSDGANAYGSEKGIAYYFHNNQYCGKQQFPVKLENTIWLQLSISPNPASNILTIQLPLAGRYSIKNALGQELLSGTLSGDNSDQKIDIDSLNNGVYTIVLQSAQQHYTARFIKQ
jgi:hypothetical protein